MGRRARVDARAGSRQPHRRRAIDEDEEDDRAQTLKRSLVAAVVVATALVISPARAAFDPIRPGDFIESSVGGCTLGFVFDAVGKVYFATAAHCVDRVGEDIALEDGSIFGDVAAIGDPSTAADDWALVLVRAAFAPYVRAGVRGNTSAPAGYTKPDQTADGDTVAFSGWGTPWFAAPELRERRVGVLAADDTHTYQAIGPTTIGDSGGPVVHELTGKALGLVTGGCTGACTSPGLTVQGLLAKANARGLGVRLRTP